MADPLEARAAEIALKTFPLQSYPVISERRATLERMILAALRETAAETLDGAGSICEYKAAVWKMNAMSEWEAAARVVGDAIRARAAAIREGK